MTHTVPDTRPASILDTLPDAEALLERRRAIADKLAPLRALYGGAGYMGERVFKIEEAKVATAVRARFKADKDAPKVTEPMVDAAVRQTPAYIDALMAEVEKKAKWIALEEQLNEVEWRLQMRTTDGYLLGKEAGLTR